MGSRLTRSGMDKVYAAALRWVHHALQSDGSLFTPGKPIWSSERLAAVRRSVQDKPDTAAATKCSKPLGRSKTSQLAWNSKAHCSKAKTKTRICSVRCLLHLVHPDTFEAIVNVAIKEKIAAAFPYAVKDTNADVDRKLQQIRANLEKQIGAHDYLFYKPVIRGYWDDKASNCLP